MGAAATAPGEADEPPLLRDPRLHAVLLMATIAPMGAAVVSPTLPGMASALEVSDARIGLVMTALTLPPMLLAPVMGVAGDLLGRRTVALPSLALFGVAGVAIGFADSFAVVLALRALQGMATAGIAPVVVTLLGDLYRGPAATTAQGLRTSVGGLSLSAVPLAAGWLAGFGWTYPFAIYAGALVVGVVLYRAVPETASAAAEEVRLRAALAGYWASVRTELADRRLQVVLLGGFVRFFSLFGFLTFVPLFAVRALDATAFEAGIIVALTGVRVVVSPTAGAWVAHLGRRGALAAALVLVAGAFALMPLAPSVYALGALAAVHAAGDGIISPVINDAVTASVRAEHRNGVVSALRVLKEAGKTAGPVALGVALAVGGFGGLFAVAVAVLVGYLLLVLALAG